MHKPLILVVDDESQTLRYVSLNLKAHGYDVLTAGDGTEALKVFSENIVDLILLDLMMPGPDGYAVTEHIRQESDVPIIILSAKGQERDKVKALDVGADDYLTKPFGIEEMLARVRATLRRTTTTGTGVLQPFSVGGLTIDFTARQVSKDGEEVRLTPTEYGLLAHLARNAGKVLTHRALLQAVWGPEYGDEHDYLWAYIRRLRRKLEKDSDQPPIILTEPGVGYRLASPEQQATVSSQQ